MKEFIWIMISYHCLSLKEVGTETEAGQECVGGAEVEAMKEWIAPQGLFNPLS